MNAIEMLMMNAVLKSVKDFNNSIEILDSAVKKYFKDNHDDVFNEFIKWEFVEDGNLIKYIYEYKGLDNEYGTDVVNLETIVSIAVDLSFNKN